MQATEADRKALQEFIDQGNLVPDRGSAIGDPDIKWRSGKPDYTKANLAFFRGRTRKHPSGSLELFVENAVKKWEMEAHNMGDPKQWTVTDVENCTVTVNGGPEITAKRAAEMGNYNLLMATCPAHLYDAKSETFESSEKKFKSTFLDGFPWEVLEVFSGPPKISVLWRHWATFNGKYQDRQGQGEKIEMRGVTIIELNDKGQVVHLDVYFKPDEFLQTLVSSGKKIE